LNASALFENCLDKNKVRCKTSILNSKKKLVSNKTTHRVKLSGVFYPLKRDKLFSPYFKLGYYTQGGHVSNSYATGIDVNFSESLTFRVEREKISDNNSTIGLWLVWKF
jgi:hypothetical protein